MVLKHRLFCIRENFSVYNKKLVIFLQRLIELRLICTNWATLMRMMRRGSPLRRSDLRSPRDQRRGKDSEAIRDPAIMGRPDT